MNYRKVVLRMKKRLPKKVFFLLSFIKNVPSNLRSFYLEKKYAFLNRYKKVYGVTTKKRKIPIIMSDTTFPARIDKVYLSIETIMRQSVKPDYIYLWLANDEFPGGKSSIPRRLLDLEKRGLKIKFTKNNLRSNNKLFHTLKENQESIVITFDDDCFYSRDCVKNLLICHKRHPNDIIGYDSHQIKIDKKGDVLPYNDWFEYDKNKQVGMDLFLLSVNGILYPPGSLHKEVFNDKVLRKISLFNDDVWFKAMALLNNVPHRRVFKKNKKFPTIIDTQRFGLFHSNVVKNRNDKIIKDVFGKYNLIRYLKR